MYNLIIAYRAGNFQWRKGQKEPDFLWKMHKKSGWFTIICWRCDRYSPNGCPVSTVVRMKRNVSASPRSASICIK